MGRIKGVLIILAGLGVLLAIAFQFIYGGAETEAVGVVHPGAVAPAVRQQREQARTAGLPADAQRQILFGDLHVHTTFSADAFMMSLPLLAGEGAHPPADACDFARFCSGLDFFALTDHAEALTPKRWQETRQSVRDCNAVAGDPDNPDVVAFTGWEWTQIGQTPEQHYGHKNVIFREQADDRLPSRPVAATGLARQAFSTALNAVGAGTMLSVPLLDFPNRKRYADFVNFFRENGAVPECPQGPSVRDLPDDCREIAATPAVLFEKLDQWGFDAMVIPHGTTWGFYTPPGYTWDKQLTAAQNDPERQDLVEIFSGHGNSEDYRDWRASLEGSEECPAPSGNFEPCCHRAGEIMRGRCGDIPESECARRVQDARRFYVRAQASGHLAVPGTEVEEWGNCGQCDDCFDPAFMYRPGGSTQYMMARGDFSDPDNPRHIQPGFIASSDNHKARPGTGYKEFARREMGEATGARSEAWRERVFTPEPRSDTPRDVGTQVAFDFPPWLVVDTERQASFFRTGGLAAVHSAGRNREAIWDALKRREVYGTSGPRILLWFDLLDSDAGGDITRTPMGSRLALGKTPRFEVRALASMEQAPGCPDHSVSELPAERLQRLCLGECYNPTDQRRRITRIEVVRVQPQRSNDEALTELIQDTFLSLPCSADGPLCTVQFEDPRFLEQARDTAYYVRAIEEPSLSVNGDSLRCERDAQGTCTSVKPCYGDYRTPLDEPCLAKTEERAWSSPIYLSYTAPPPDSKTASGAEGAAGPPPEPADEPAR